jgi:hypothetical protein
MIEMFRHTCGCYVSNNSISGIAHSHKVNTSRSFKLYILSTHAWPSGLRIRLEGQYIMYRPAGGRTQYIYSSHLLVIGLRYKRQD